MKRVFYDFLVIIGTLVLVLIFVAAFMWEMEKFGLIVATPSSSSAALSTTTSTASQSFTVTNQECIDEGGIPTNGGCLAGGPSHAGSGESQVYTCETNPGAPGPGYEWTQDYPCNEKD